ncbi:NAD(P)H-quinone oxidoreductase subunit O [Oscillatoria sp. FACHB-1406]|uniref:NAD(P)H-quinone oxidoreductase subunit O n=1 Tax=Oscillatoria sp. FACHB-1406 TaxID=2692846 RepID=UPI001686C271|nr:NAD(P)H-quinone oxidoreductase subunit O [Oscillatoria sp. FACHB-1406]MBD2578173.1 NAD(P)H-quinone oxidoreductase subunit O [Oscillatoria sp. FACHB-1406]
MADKLKKGSFVRVSREKLDNSLEAKASDNRFSSYLFESKGEILELNDEYALVKFYVPTPNIWLRLDQLEAA